MPSFLPHRISPPSKLVVLNQACLDLPTASSEERKWGDDEEVEVADNEDSSRRLDKGKAPMERNDTDEEEEEAYFESDPSEICDDDDDTEMEDDMAEATRGFEQLYMPRRITQAQWEEIEQYAEGTNKEVAIHELITPRKPRRQRKPRPRIQDSEGIWLEHSQEVAAEAVKFFKAQFQETNNFDNPEILRHLKSLVKLNQSCVELPTSSSERRKWGDDWVEEEAESDEDGYAQITMDFREPRSPVGSIDSDTPIVRLDANILHPRVLRMLGFTTNEGLEFEGMTEDLTIMFKDPADYVLAPPRARTVLKQPERTQEVHSQVSSSSSSTTGDTMSVQTPSATPHRQIIPRETVKVSTPTYNALGRAPEPIRSARAQRALRRKAILRSLKE
ncbi:hypothetical protein K7X08_030114 [Anisodus acutangulus]|uniref:Uncharacterized protein n=1 Tax=Anisodus acutangulus TaxID=402998 RepID=A0A9Q1LLX2_9SOLA|nr:hypothetical protein K7X08_030114 [Anisodus acutangulus]